MSIKTFKSFINEGGNAVKDSRIGRINQENVEGTMNDIYKKVLPLLNITKKDTGNLGSTGKKLPGGSSGDVDLAIDIHAVLRNNKNIKNVDDLFDKLVSIAKSLHMEYKDMRQMGLVSIGFPIHNTDGKQEGKLVQLDFMPTENLEYSKWAYYSPAEWESKWKGLYRNEVFYAIAKYMSFKVLKKAMDKEGKEVPVEWERNFFDLSKGLLKGTQTRMGKKGPVKTVKTISKEMVSMDAQEIVTMLFGPNYKPSDILTWEDIMKAIKSPKFIYKKNLPKIIKMVQDGISKKGYPVPEDL